MKKIYIVAPAFNEATTLSEVIKDLKKNGYKNIILGDDGSTDKTFEIAKKLKVVVYRHLINRGLGANLGTGLELAKKFEADIVITFDMDGQMQAQDIKRLIQPILTGQADVVIGDRMKNYRQMPVDRLIITFLASMVTFLLYGVWFADSQSGLRAFNQTALNSIAIKTQRMEVSSEILREIRRNRLKMASIPIKPIYTKYSRGKNDNKSNLNAISVGFKMLLSLFR